MTTISHIPQPSFPASDQRWQRYTVHLIQHDFSALRYTPNNPVAGLRQAAETSCQVGYTVDHTVDHTVQNSFSEVVQPMTLSMQTLSHMLFRLSDGTSEAGALSLFRQAAETAFDIVNQKYDFRYHSDPSRNSQLINPFSNHYLNNSIDRLNIAPHQDIKIHKSVNQSLNT